MASQPDLTAILAALAQRTGTNSNPIAQPTPQPPLSAGFPGVVSAATPSNPLAGLALPQPTNSGSLDLSAIKPASSGTVSLADALAKARNNVADKASSRDDPRLAGRGFKRSRSRSRSPTRRENYRDNYNPFRDQRRDDTRKGSNGRDRSASPQGRTAFSTQVGQTYGRERSPGLSQAVDNNTEIITVESSSVGLIIGRSGENLKRVESETGARVQFITGPDSNAPLRQCKVSGNPRQRAEAKREIFRIAEENPRAAPGRIPQGLPPAAQSPTLREGEKSMQIMVPDRTVGLIIGRGGETIRDLQERSGCHVNIVGENKSINGLRPVNLIGTREAAAKAKEMISEIVESDTRLGGAGSSAASAAISAPAMALSPPGPMPGYGRMPAPYDPYASGYDPSGGSKINDMIVIPSEAVGMVIGKGGETIKDMQSSTGCKINVSPPAGVDINREIGLIGTRMAIESAKRAIWDKVNTVREKQGGLRADSIQQYGDPYSQYQPPAYGQPTQGQMPPAQAMPAPVAPDQPDPYAAYGGYNNYVSLWYSAMANQGGPGQGPPHGA